MSKEIWVFSDNMNLTFELISAGKSIADAIGGSVAVVVISPEKHDANEYIYHGADKVYLLTNEKFKDVLVDTYAHALASLAKKYSPYVILVGATKNGRDIAPYLAQLLDTGFASDALDLQIENDKLLIKRQVFGGKSIATETFEKAPYVVTVPEKRYQPKEKDTSRTGDVVEEAIEPKESKLKVLSKEEKKVSGVKLDEAAKIVAIGRGIKNENDIEMVKELAKLIGAEVGASRPVIADLGWMKGQDWIGISGVAVKPDLYIALGISGQIQHVAGIMDSKIIVAVNKDENAPIFEFADYGIVGDVYKIVPLLIEELKKLKK